MEVQRGKRGGGRWCEDQRHSGGKCEEGVQQSIMLNERIKQQTLQTPRSIIVVQNRNKNSDHNTEERNNKQSEDVKLFLMTKH